MTTPTNRRLTLEGLAAEIRDEINYYFAVEAEPLPAFIMTRLRRRTPNDSDSSFKFDRALVTEEAMKYPRLPALAYVNAQAYPNVTALFYKHNTFVFCLKDEHTKSVLAWYSRVPRREEGQMEAHLEHAILEFCVSFHPGLAPGHSDIDVQLEKDGQLKLNFGGCIGRECTCWIERMAAGYPKGLHSANAVVDFAIHFEEYCKNELSDSMRGRGSSGCQQCGKRNVSFSRDSPLNNWLDGDSDSDS
ncbi:hypothetical protein LTR37_004527 [Vermiconidia calcicola]|uniref:Uncharacterized protein n=1 Tax=Vermiconidia calcicola TaxID=1690605 RepID=A0ACC3NMR3_9PEZI|nr:hypothetical protein LTR37_004527 [Vermiconidia calcicola]